MRTKYIKFMVTGVVAASLAACSLDTAPISSPSELTEGRQNDTVTAVLKDRDAAVSQRTAIYQLFKNR